MVRILIVEDDTELQHFLCEVLEEVPAACECVATKAEAETILPSNRFDLVIADVRLPDGSGHDVASLASAAGTKTLLMSGYPDDITALTAGAVEHLRKPFRVSDFIEMIKRQLGL